MFSHIFAARPLPPRIGDRKRRPPPKLSHPSLRGARGRRLRRRRRLLLPGTATARDHPPPRRISRCASVVPTRCIPSPRLSLCRTQPEPAPPCPAAAPLFARRGRASVRLSSLRLNPPRPAPPPHPAHPLSAGRSSPPPLPSSLPAEALPAQAAQPRRAPIRRRAAQRRAPLPALRRAPVRRALPRSAPLSLPARAPHRALAHPRARAT